MRADSLRDLAIYKRYPIVSLFGRWIVTRVSICRSKEGLGASVHDHSSSAQFEAGLYTTRIGRQQSLQFTHLPAFSTVTLTLLRQAEMPSNCHASGVGKHAVRRSGYAPLPMFRTHREARLTYKARTTAFSHLHVDKA